MVAFKRGFMKKPKIGGYTDGNGGTLKATVNGHPATFDGETWSFPSDPETEGYLNQLSRSERLATIDATAAHTLSRVALSWSIDSFTRDREYHLALNPYVID